MTHMGVFNKCLIYNFFDSVPKEALHTLGIVSTSFMIKLHPLGFSKFPNRLSRALITFPTDVK